MGIHQLYFSRHAALVTFAVEDLLDVAALPELLRDFRAVVRRAGARPG